MTDANGGELMWEANGPLRLANNTLEGPAERSVIMRDDADMQARVAAANAEAERQSRLLPNHFRAPITMTDTDTRTEVCSWCQHASHPPYQCGGGENDCRCAQGIVEVRSQRRVLGERPPSS